MFEPLQTARVDRARLNIYTPFEVSLILDNTLGTLEAWRNRGEGPKYIKLGKSIFYRHDDLKEWVDGSIVRHRVEA